MSFRDAGFFTQWYPPDKDGIEVYGVFTTPQMAHRIGCSTIVRVDGAWTGVLVLEGGGLVAEGRKSKPFISETTDLEVARRKVEKELHEFYTESRGS